MAFQSSSLCAGCSCLVYGLAPTLCLLAPAEVSTQMLLQRGPPPLPAPPSQDYRKWVLLLSSSFCSLAALHTRQVVVMFLFMCYVRLCIDTQHHHRVPWACTYCAPVPALHTAAGFSSSARCCCFLLGVPTLSQTSWVTSLSHRETAATKQLRPAPAPAGAGHQEARLPARRLPRSLSHTPGP